MNWVRIEQLRPLQGSRVLAFTPTFGALRFRIVDSDLLNTLTEATHWCYLMAPDEVAGSWYDSVADLRT